MKSDQFGVPPGSPPIGPAPHVGEQRGPVRVAVIVERQSVADDDDVVAGITLGRSNPDGAESGVRVGVEERVRQDVARPAREEDPVRQGPSF